MSRVWNGITQHYPTHHRAVGTTAYLVATKDETTREVATKLGIGDPVEGEEITSGIVVPVVSFWGRHDKDLWEWILVRQRSDG